VGGGEMWGVMWEGEMGKRRWEREREGGEKGERWEGRTHGHPLANPQYRRSR